MSSTASMQDTSFFLSLDCSDASCFAAMHASCEFVQSLLKSRVSVHFIVEINAPYRDFRLPLFRPSEERGSRFFCGANSMPPEHRLEVTESILLDTILVQQYYLLLLQNVASRTQLPNLVAQGFVKLSYVRATPTEGHCWGPALPPDILFYDTANDGMLTEQEVMLSVQAFEQDAGNWGGYFPADATACRLPPSAALASHGEQMEALRLQYVKHLKAQIRACYRKRPKDNAQAVDFAIKEFVLHGLTAGAGEIFMLLCRPGTGSFEAYEAIKSSQQGVKRITCAAGCMLTMDPADEEPGTEMSLQGSSSTVHARLLLQMQSDGVPVLCCPTQLSKRVVRNFAHAQVETGRTVTDNLARRTRSLLHLGGHTGFNSAVYVRLFGVFMGGEAQPMHLPLPIFLLYMHVVKDKQLTVAPIRLQPDLTFDFLPEQEAASIFIPDVLRENAVLVNPLPLGMSLEVYLSALVRWNMLGPSA